MKNLSKRNTDLILTGLKTTGQRNSAENSYNQIKEQLYPTETKIIHDFITWLYKSGRSFSHNSAQIRFNEYKDACRDHEYYLKYTFEYENETIDFSKKLKKPTLKEVGLSMRNCSLNNTYKAIIIDQNKNIIKELNNNKIVQCIKKTNRFLKKLSFKEKFNLFENHAALI